MMINLRKLFIAVDLSSASFPANRVANLLTDISVMLGKDQLEISEKELAMLKERFRAHLQTTELSPRTITEKVCRLNRLLQMAADQGLIQVSKCIPLPPRPKKNGPALRRYNALRLLDDWLRINDISVSKFTDENFRSFRNELKRRGTTCAEDQYNCAVKSWQELFERRVVHALQPPRWNDDSKVDYGLPSHQWPSLVVDDFERFCRAASGQAKSGEKRRKLLRSDSIENVQSELSRFLGYLVNIRGKSITDIGLLEILEDRDKLIGFISWHIAERCDGKERKHHRETLRWFAHFLEWLDGDMEIAGFYRLTAKSLKTQRARDPFPERPIPYKEFTQASLRALEKAQRDWEAALPLNCRSQQAISAALAYRDAFLFSFLVCRPMRSRNMREMKLGTNLNKSGEVWRLHFSEDEMKAAEYKCRFPKVLLPYLEFYLAEIRPSLAGEGNMKAVFLTKSGKCIGRSDFWKIMTKAGERIMGLRTNPHLFRYLIPSAYLLRFPNRALEMQALLGHSVLETTLRYYIHIYSRIASQRAAEVLRKHCPAMVELCTLFPPTETP